MRLFAGALVLLPFLDRNTVRANLGGGVMLALYAIAFALAYVRLDAASGALLLFAVVQATIVGGGLARSERPTRAGLAGIGLAFGGIVVLLGPGTRAVDPVGAALMAAAGVGWGGYTLIGKRGGPSAPRNAANFLIAAMLALPFLLVDGPVSPRGMGLAVVSGALTSGLGYVA